MGGHHHHHHGDGTGKILSWSLLVTLTFVVLETVAGFRSGSLALLSDAGHNFTDALALLLAAFGHFLQSKPPDSVKTFGYQRAGVLAAFINALTLVLLSCFILWESWQRLWHPEPIQEMLMVSVAALGFIVNMAIVWGLHERQKGDLNLRAAFVHMLGDAISSLAIVAGGLIIRFTARAWVDPILSALIALMIVWTAWDIIKESLNVLLEGLPEGLHLDTVAVAMRGVTGVIDVHDLHIWTLGSHAHALSCHVLIEDMPPSESNAILCAINGVLHREFHIHHTTIQFEHTPCPTTDGCAGFTSTHSHSHAH